MKIAVLTSDTPHHRFFLHKINSKYAIDSIFYETKSLKPKFDNTSPFKEQEENFEEENFFKEFPNSLLEIDSYFFESLNCQDSLAKFDSKKVEPAVIESPEMASERFEQSFKNRAGQVKPFTAPIDKKLRDAAALVLDTHDKTIVRNEADELLTTIDSEGISQPVNENKKLPDAQYNPNMTMRNDPRNILNDGKQTATEFTKSVPLPDKDDLDF